MARYREPFTIVRPAKKGGCYRYRLGYQDGEQRPQVKSTGKKTKYEAIQFCKNLVKQEENPGASVTLEEYAKDFYLPGKCEWLKDRVEIGRAITNKEARDRRSHLEHYLFPKFGKMALTEITAGEFQRWRNTLPRANSTRNHIRESLSRILDQAFKDQLIAFNPIRLTQPVSSKVFRQRDILSLEEIEDLFPSSRAKQLQIWKEPRYFALYHLALKAGLRSGEIRALRWKHLLFDEGVVVVENAIKSDGNIGTTKNKQRRIVPLTDDAVTTMKKWQKTCPGTGNDDFVFPGIRLTDPISKEAVAENFQRGLKRAGINLDAKRNLVFHSLRHTFVTLNKYIVEDEVLQKFAGHQSQEMQDRYTHVETRTLIKLAQEQRANVERAFNEHKRRRNKSENAESSDRPQAKIIPFRRDLKSAG